MFDFGPLAAQNDRDLLGYFHISGQAKHLVDPKGSKQSFLFIARPGSGKTSLVKWLSEKTENRLTIVISTETTRLSAADPHLNAGDIQVMISSELYAALISEIVAQNFASDLTTEAKQFLSKGWKEIVGNFFEKLFVGVSILGCGFTLKPDERRSYLQEIRRTDRLNAGRSVLKKLASRKEIVLVLDDPELLVSEGLDDITPDNARRLGALLSVLAEVHSIGVRVIAFLKEHIVQNVRAYHDNFQHFADRIEGLEWTAEDLIAMLRCRVRTRLNTSWAAIFECAESDVERKIFPFLVNGPRDLLTLCNLAGKEAGKISLARLEKSRRAYKADKWRDLHTYYNRQWPGVDRFALAMVDILKKKYEDRPIPPGGIKAQFEAEFVNPGSDIHRLRSGAQWIENAKYVTPSIEEKLFVMGCLGYVSEGQRYFPWAGRDIDRFKLADSYFVSPIYAA